MIPYLMRRLERLGNLPGGLKCFLERQWPAFQAVRQGFALDQFHDEEVTLSGLLKVVNDGDVRG